MYIVSMSKYAAAISPYDRHASEPLTDAWPGVGGAPTVVPSEHQDLH